MENNERFLRQGVHHIQAFRRKKLGNLNLKFASTDKGFGFY